MNATAAPPVPGSSLGNIATAIDQHAQGVTGDQHSAWTRAGNAPHEMLAVGQRWADGVGQARKAWSDINEPATPGGPPPTAGEKTARVIRAVQQTAGALMGGLGLMKDALDVGFANLTAPLAAVMPSLPAATLMSPYIGTPHAHVAHPPSGPPPVPPTPMPSIGMAMLGHSVKVLINNMPAARVDDIGLAPTCCGIPPAWFKIKTGSSNVFIGGNRAARLGDICKACPVVPDPPAIPAGKVMAAIGKAAEGASKAMAVAGVAVGALGIAADVAEEAVADDAAVQAGKALSAAMASAQMAMDAAKQAAEKLMWKDVPVLPPTGSIGAIVDPSHATVLIGGFPMIHIPDPVGALLNRLSRYKPKASSSNEGCGKEGEPVDVVTGANLEDSIDYPLSAAVGITWRRAYDSTRHNVRGPLGYGWRHTLEDELRFDADGVTYVPVSGVPVMFPPLPHDRARACRDGWTLRRVNAAIFRLRRTAGPTLEFVVPPGGGTGQLSRAFTERDELRLTHDPRGRLTSIHRRGEPPIALVYDARGFLTGLVESADHGSQTRLVSYEYDASEDLVAWTDAMGHRATLTYDASHRLIRKGDRRGYSYHYRYDVQGRCVHSAGDDGMYDVSLRYVDGARATEVTHSDGGIWTYCYDENGTITRIIDPYGTPRERETDDSGKVVLERDGTGNEYAIVHDAAGGVVGRRDPFGHVSADLMDLRRHNHRALVAPTTPLEWETGSLLRPRHIRAAPGNGVEVQVAVTSTYDRLGRKVEERLGREAVRRWTYDGNGNVLHYEDGDGFRTRFDYTSWNLLQREADARGRQTVFSYTPRERVRTVTDAGGTTSEYEYDLRDNITRVIRHGRVRDRYLRDRADNLIEKQDGAGQTLLRFEVGAGNLPTLRRLASGDTHTFAYDGLARLTRATTDAHDITFDYAGAGRRPTTDIRDGVGVRHRLDGLRRTCRVLERFEIVYLQQDGRLTVTDPTGGKHQITVAPEGSVTVASSNGRTETRRYDRHGRCLSKRQTGWRQRPWSRDYVYSPEGDLLAVRDNQRGGCRYRYDAGHRLEGEVRRDQELVRYDHDVAGNLLAKESLAGVVMGPGNRLRAANGETFEYNDRDHVASRTGAQGTTTYEYDSCDRLIRCLTPTGEWRSLYDPLGRRITKSWLGETTEYYWDHHRLAAERAPGGELRLYVYLDADALVPFMFVDYDSQVTPEESGRRYFISTDQIGMPLRVEDEHGAVVWEAEVEAYGVTKVRSGNRVDFAMRFPGHYEDSEIGLFYNRFRHYSPVLGRYLQSDPMGTAGGVNLYAYPANPLTAVDLFGLHPPKEEGEEGASATGVDDEKTVQMPRPLTPEEEAAAKQLVSITRGLAKSMVDNEDPGRGPVLTGVIDPRYPEDGPFFGQNTGLPKDLSKPLQGNLDDHVDNIDKGIAQPRVTAGKPTDGHSEVNALDQALKNRSAREGGRETTQDDLNDMIGHNVNLKKGPKVQNDDGTTTRVPAGEGCPPRCDHCRPISGGTRMVDKDGQLTDHGGGGDDGDE
jgi:RHS repeat-associated protein